MIHFRAVTLVALVAPLLLPAPAVAASHAFKIHNNMSTAMTSFRVRGGEVEGFKRLAGGKEITVTVTMPDANCTAYAQARFGSVVADGKVNICDEGGYVVTSGSDGPRFLPLSEVLIVR